jgi:hypothetical protein
VALETFLISHTDLIFRVISGGGAIAKLHFMLLWQVHGEGYGLIGLRSCIDLMTTKISISILKKRCLRKECHKFCHLKLTYE